jgi:hypothetical protein
MRQKVGLGLRRSPTPEISLFAYLHHKVAIARRSAPPSRTAVGRNNDPTARPLVLDISLPFYVFISVIGSCIISSCIIISSYAAATGVRMSEAMTVKEATTLVFLLVLFNVTYLRYVLRVISQDGYCPVEYD